MECESVVESDSHFYYLESSVFLLYFRVNISVTFVRLACFSSNFVPALEKKCGMINKYEERLGTERMLPLVFKMALPAVAAQFVNLLYSIVDRIYIGHIPGIGTDALAGVGVTTSLIILISSFSAIVGGGGRWLLWHLGRETVHGLGKYWEMASFC